MIMRFYSVYDSAVGSFANPFLLHSDLEAKRAFISACGDPSTQFNRNPSDYSLMYVGSFDTDRGLIESAVPSLVVSALEAVTIAHRLKADRERFEQQAAAPRSNFSINQED